MRAFWVTAEILDLAVMRALTSVDRWLGRKSYEQRVEQSVRAPDPTAAPKFEK